jgi:predicted transposase YdaD
LVLLIPPAVKKLKEQGRAKGRVEGRLEGRAEERAEWEAWLMRRNEAEANNQPFDEQPSPSQRQ